MSPRIATLAALAIAVSAHAQPPGRGGPAQPPRPPKAAAPVDFTGYWVAVVTEDWRWRMVTPIKGDFASIPLNAEGVRVGDAWDPARDERDGTSAGRMAPLPSCACRDACTSPGTMTTL